MEVIKLFNFFLRMKPKKCSEVRKLKVSEKQLLEHIGLIKQILISKLHESDRINRFVCNILQKQIPIIYRGEKIFSTTKKISECGRGVMSITFKIEPRLAPYCLTVFIPQLHREIAQLEISNGMITVYIKVGSNLLTPLKILSRHFSSISLTLSQEEMRLNFLDYSSTSGFYIREGVIKGKNSDTKGLMTLRQQVLLDDAYSKYLKIFYTGRNFCLVKNYCKERFWEEFKAAYDHVLSLKSVKGYIKELLPTIKVSPYLVRDLFLLKKDSIYIKYVTLGIDALSDCFIILKRGFLKEIINSGFKGVEIKSHVKFNHPVNALGTEVEPFGEEKTSQDDCDVECKKNILKRFARVYDFFNPESKKTHCNKNLNQPFCYPELHFSNKVKITIKDILGIIYPSGKGIDREMTVEMDRKLNSTYEAKYVFINDNSLYYKGMVPEIPARNAKKLMNSNLFLGGVPNIILSKQSYYSVQIIYMVALIVVGLLEIPMSDVPDYSSEKYQNDLIQELASAIEV